MKKALLVATCLFCLALGARPALAADTTWYPGSVPLGIDARSLGMGGACLAVIDPWVFPANPAALVFVTDQGVFAGRYVDPVLDPVTVLGEQDYLYLFYVHPDEGNGAYSIGASQDTFTNLFSNAFFSADLTRFTALQYGYGYKLTDHISLGMNLRKVWTLDHTAPCGNIANQFFTVDLGAVFRPNQGITAAILLTDALSPVVRLDMDLNDDGEVDHLGLPIKSYLIFGGSFHIGRILLIAADVDYNIASYDDLWDMTRVGVQVHPLPFLFVRGGYYHGQPTAGVGLRLGNPDGVQVNLDFGQYWPNAGEYLNITQSMQMVVYF